ncbi:MAG: glycosyltransferase family 87 protein [Candidatus Omnitrophota bacterium]
MKRVFSGAFLFLTAVIFISLAADLCFLSRNTAWKQGIDGWEGMPDFKVYWACSRNFAERSVFLAGKDERREKKGRFEYAPVYDKNEEFYHFRYSPLAALVMVPFAKIDYPAVSLLLWSLSVNIAFICALFILTRRLSRDFGVTETRKYVIMWVTFLGTARYYLMIIGQGQTDAFVTLFFVLFLMAYLDGRHILCGFLIAVILQVKLLFLPMLVYFIFRGKFRIVISGAVFFLLFLFLPSCVIGIRENIVLLGEWKDILKISVTSQLMNFKNQSVAYGISVLLLKNGWIRGHLTPEKLIYPLSAFFTLLSYGALILYGKISSRSRQPGYGYVEVSFLLIMCLLFAPTSWEAYYSALIIPAAFTVLLILKNPGHVFPYAAAAFYFFFSCAIGTDITKYIPGVNSARFINISLGTVFLAAAMASAYEKYIVSLRDTVLPGVPGGNIFAKIPGRN